MLRKLPFVLTLLLLTACGGKQQTAVDDVDFAKYCTDSQSNPVRTAPEAMCQQSGDSPTARFKWYYQELPHHVWQGDRDITPDYAFMPYGSPIMGYDPMYYRRPYNYSYRQPLVRSMMPVRRAVSVPYATFQRTTPKVPVSAFAPPAANSAPNTGIQRGGLGVPTAPRYTPPPTAPKYSPPPPRSAPMGRTK